MSKSVHWGHPVIVSLWLFQREFVGGNVFFSSHISRSRRAQSSLDEDTTEHHPGAHCLGMTGPGQWTGGTRGDFGGNEEPL